MQLDACYCIPHYLNNVQLTIHVCVFIHDRHYQLYARACVYFIACDFNTCIVLC